MNHEATEVGHSVLPFALAQVCETGVEESIDDNNVFYRGKSAGTYDPRPELYIIYVR